MRSFMMFLLPIATLVAACGDDDDNDELCDQIRAKVVECNLNVNTSGQCQSDASDKVLCAARCLVNAECSQITGAVADNPYYRCAAQCSGAGPNDFLCRDGAGFLPPAGVCDGTPQCPDRSDEASCPP